MKRTMCKRWGKWQCSNRAGMFKGERISAVMLSLQTWGGGQFERSSFTTAQKAHLAFWVEMISIPARVRARGSLNAGEGRLTFVHRRECELNNAPDTFVIFINNVTSTCGSAYSWIHYLLIHFPLNVFTSPPFFYVESFISEQLGAFASCFCHNFFSCVCLLPL